MVFRHYHYRLVNMFNYFILYSRAVRLVVVVVVGKERGENPYVFGIFAVKERDRQRGEKNYETTSRRGSALIAIYKRRARVRPDYAFLYAYNNNTRTHIYIV